MLEFKPASPLHLVSNCAESPPVADAKNLLKLTSKEINWPGIINLIFLQSYSRQERIGQMTQSTRHTSGKHRSMKVEHEEFPRSLWVGRLVRVTILRRHVVSYLRVALIDQRPPRSTTTGAVSFSKSAVRVPFAAPSSKSQSGCRAAAGQPARDRGPADAQ